MPLDLIARRLQAFRSQSRVGQQQLEEFCKESPFERTKREVKDQLAKAEQYRAAILKNVTTFAGLNPEAIVAAAQSMEEVFYQKGDIVIRQDDIGDCFYVLEEGLVSVTRKTNPKDPEEAPRELTKLGRNAHFGEIALLTAEPRSATVTVISEEAKCLKMTKHEFEELLATTNKLQAESRRQIGRDVLDTVPLFKTLTSVNKKKLLESMIPMTYLPGSYICRQGTTGNTFFILTEGSCRVTINTNDRSEREVAALRAGDFFGEVALIESSNRRTANVISNNTVSCLTLSRSDFNRLLRNLKVKLMEHQAMRTSTTKAAQETGTEVRQMSSLSRKRRISGYNTHGQRDEVRIANLLRRFAKFTTEALWNSMYSRFYRELVLDNSKVAEYGKFASSVMRNSTRYEAVTAIAEQTIRILELDCARRTSAEHAYILGIMKQRSQMRDKLCKGWPQHHFIALCKRLKVMRIKPFRKIVEADTRGTTAFLILRGAVRIYGSVKRGDAQAKAYFEEDLFPGEIFGEAALSGMHTRLLTAISITNVDVVVIDDQDYMAAQDRDTQLMGTEERSQFLNEIPLFRHWDSYKLIRLAHALVQEELSKNFSLTSHRAVTPSMYFIVQGRVDVVDSLEKRNVITTLGPHDYCGESGLLNRFVKAVNKKVSEDFFALAATRVDVLVLPESAFHLFDTNSVDMLRAAFEVKASWRGDRVQTMKWERAKVRKQYHLMHLEASLMDDLSRPNPVEAADPAPSPRKSPMRSGATGTGRSVSSLVEEEVARPDSPCGEDMSQHLQALRSASPPPDFPQSFAPVASDEVDVSAVDAAYRAALVHPLDDRLRNEEVWLPPTRTGPRTKMDRMDDIPAVLAQDLDMLMVSSSCKDVRRLERIQESVQLARKPLSARMHRLPELPQRPRSPSPEPADGAAENESIDSNLQEASSLQFYVRSLMPPAASNANANTNGFASAQLVRPSTAPGRGSSIQPITSPLLQPQKRVPPSSASPLRMLVRVEMPSLPSTPKRKPQSAGQRPSLPPAANSAAGSNLLLQLGLSNSLTRYSSNASFLQLAPGSALDREPAVPNPLPTPSRSHSGASLQQQEQQAPDGWGLSVQAMRPQSATPVAAKPQRIRLKSAGANRPQRPRPAQQARPASAVTRGEPPAAPASLALASMHSLSEDGSARS